MVLLEEYRIVTAIPRFSFTSCPHGVSGSCVHVTEGSHRAFNAWY